MNKANEDPGGIPYTGVYAQIYGRGYAIACAKGYSDFHAEAFADGYVEGWLDAGDSAVAQANLCFV